MEINPLGYLFCGLMIYAVTFVVIYIMLLWRNFPDDRAWRFALGLALLSIAGLSLALIVPMPHKRNGSRPRYRSPRTPEEIDLWYQQKLRRLKWKRAQLLQGNKDDG